MRANILPDSSYYKVPRVVKFMETERRMVVARSCGKWRRREIVFNGHRVSAGEDKEKFWRGMVGDGCIAM